MADQRGDLGRAGVAEIGKIRRQIEAAIAGHQVLDAVEIAAEGEVVNALLAAAALPVEIEHDDVGALRVTDGDVADIAGVGLQQQILLHLAHAGVDILRLRAALRHFVTGVDIAQFAIVDDCIGALGREDGRIGEQIVLEGL